MASGSKVKSVAKSTWRFVILAGVLSILFGLFAMFWPGLTVSILVTIFGAFIVATGLVWLVMSFASIKVDPVWWLSTLFSILCMAAGVYLLVNPSITITLFVILVAIIIFVQALVDLVGASYSDEKSTKWIWTLFGVLGVAFGVVILLYPEDATNVFIWLVGLYAFIRGVVDIVYACRAKRGVKKVIKAAKSAK